MSTHEVMWERPCTCTDAGPPIEVSTSAGYYLRCSNCGESTVIVFFAWPDEPGSLMPKDAVRLLNHALSHDADGTTFDPLEV